MIWQHSIEYLQRNLSGKLTSTFEVILKFISDHLTNVDRLDAVSARGGPLKPLEGGTYAINESMLKDYRSEKYSSHASNLGALLTDKICSQYAIPGFIVDPVTVDEFIPEAHISGVPGIERKSRSHALNIRYCVRCAAEEMNIDLASFNCVAAHLGSGFSIGAVREGRLIDVNDGLLGMGPFSVERAGALPLRGILDLVYKKGLSETELETLLTKESGLRGYLGTADFTEIERQIVDDHQAELIYSAMIYQITKEIGAMFAALNGAVDCLIVTGGLAKSAELVTRLKDRLPYLRHIRVYPGSFELTALAAGACRVLSGSETALEYA